MVLDEWDPDPDAPSHADFEDLRGPGFPKTPLAFLCEPWMSSNDGFEYRSKQCSATGPAAATFQCGGFGSHASSRRKVRLCLSFPLVGDESMRHTAVDPDIWSQSVRFSGRASNERVVVFVSMCADNAEPMAEW